MARGDGRLYLRGTTWWCGYSFRGVEQRESTHQTDEKKAMAFLKKRTKELHADELGGPAFVSPKASRLTVAQLGEALRADLELRGKLPAPTMSHLRRMISDWGQYYAAKLSTEKIDEHIEKRLSAGDKPATINRPLQLLSQAYKLAMSRAHLNRAPRIRKLSELGNARQGFLTAAQVETVITYLPEHLRDLTLWCFLTGMRKGEATALAWSMVDGSELRIPGNITKNQKPRVLPLVGTLADIIERRQAARAVELNGAVRIAEHLFHHNGRPIGDFQKRWRAACRKAGVTALFHDLRRSAVRRMVRSGIDPQVAKRWSGHSSDSMFQRYSILTTADMKEAFETVEKFHEEQKVIPMR
jgi:integrase